MSEITIVQNSVHFESFIKEIVQDIVQSRKDAGLNQQALAEWVGIDRRKIIALENNEIIDFQTILKIADLFSIEITFNKKNH